MGKELFSHVLEITSGSFDENIHMLWFVEGGK